MSTHSENLASATSIVANPQDYLATPAVIQSAWEALKESRGQSVNWLNIPSLPENLECEALRAFEGERLRKKIQSTIAQRGNLVAGMQP